MTRSALILGTLVAVLFGARPAGAAGGDREEDGGLLPLLASYAAALGDPRGLERAERLEAEIRALPLDDVLVELRDWAAGEAPLHRRITALRVLGLLPPDRALPVVIELAKGLGADERRSPVIGRCIRRTLRLFIERDSRVCELLRSCWADVPPGIRPAALQALEESGAPAAIAGLVSLLGTDSETTSAVLGVLARAPRLWSIQVEDRHRRVVAGLLASSDPTVRRMSALATGRLGWPDACPDLVELLEDEDDGVRTAALRALREMSGVRLPADRVLWTTWLAREEVWLERDLDKACEDLRSPEDDRVLHSLVRLSQHRIHRAEFLDEVLAVIDHGSADARVSACQALSGLGDPRAARKLLGLLQDREERVREAAATALAALTGFAPPPDPREWRKILRANGL